MNREFTYKGYLIRYSSLTGGMVADEDGWIAYGSSGGYTWKRLKKEIDERD